jgi:hypothetical protein
MDSMETFVTRSTITAAVLGRGTEFILCYLDGEILSDAERLLATERGYVFVGCVGMVNNRVEVECEPFLEAKVLVLIAALRFAENLYAPKTMEGDAVPWLKNLASLEDTRPGKQ